MIIASIATSSLIFIALLTGGIGGAIGWYIKKRTEGNWKKDFSQLEKKYQALIKKSENKGTKHERLKKQLENSKERVQVLEIEQKGQQKNWQAQHNEQLERFKEQEAKVQQLTSNTNYLESNLERQKADYNKLNEKYKLDIADLKEWRKNRAGFNREVKDIKGQLKVANEKLARLTVTNEKLSKELGETRVFASKLRSLKAQNAKLSEQLVFWEQKHYDVHHELTTTKTELETLQKHYRTVYMQNESANQQNQQMVMKVQEFKEKFVIINNKYHSLLESTS